MKDGLDRLSEEPCHLEGKIQSRAVSSVLNGIYGLARHLEPRGKISLGPFKLSAKNAKPIFHGLLART